MKSSDWQINKIKKDLSYVRKELASQKGLNIIGISTMCIAVAGLFITCDWSTMTTLKGFLGGLCAVIFLSVLVFYVIIPIKNEIAKTSKMSILEDRYVKQFDDDISTYVMMAASLEKEIINATDCEKIFYISEASYYINKAIVGLELIAQFAPKIIEDKEYSQKISYRRMKLICSLLYEIREKVAFCMKDGCEDIQKENDRLDKVMREIIIKSFIKEDDTINWIHEKNE